MTDQPGFADIDVTDLDVTDPADLVAMALTRAAELLPAWTPREGNVEVVLLEEFAVIMAEVARRLQDAPRQATMQILGMSGLPRLAGEPARLAVEFAVSDTLGHVIPAGTQVIVGDLGSEFPLGELTEDVTIASPDSTGAGVVELIEPGAALGLSVDTPLVLLDAVPYVESVEVTAVESAGVEPETDDAYLLRGSAWLQSMTQLLGRPDQFAARALTDPRVGRALGVNRWDGGVGAPGTVAGAVTVLLLGTDGQPMDSGDEEEVREALEGAAVTELEVYAQAPVVHEVDVTATITLLAGFSSATVLAAAEAALVAYLNPLTWPWGDAVRVSRLTQVLETVPGVDAATVTLPADDVEIDPIDLVIADAVSVSM